MSSPYRTALTSVALGLAFLVTSIAGAACPEANLILSKGMVMNEDSCLMYCKASTPNLSTRAEAVFWALGAGDPALGAGHDSGGFKGRSFIRGRAPLNYGDGTFYNYERRVETNWGASYLIDGCVTQVGPDQCTCMLLADESRGQGYFAMLSAKANRSYDFWFVEEPRLLRIPAPEVIGQRRDGDNLVVKFKVPAPARGSVPGISGGCECGPLGYRLASQNAAPDGAATASRNTRGWTAADPTVHEFGKTAEVTLPCPPKGQAAYLSTLLRLTDGFESPMVSAGAGPLTCR